jgi:multiple sugar transport system permease protein
VLFLLAMTIFPMGYSLWLAVRNYNIFAPQKARFVGLRNFGDLVHSDLFWKALRVTLLYTASALALEFVLGFLIAVLLDRRMRGIGVIRTLLVVPVFISPVAMGLTWRYMFQPSYGVINYLLGLAGVTGPNWIASTTWALPSVVMVDVWQWTPFVALILMAGMQSISPEIAEAADLDGLSRWQYLRLMALPLIRPIVVVVGLIRLIDALKTFDLIYIITRGGPVTATYTLSIHSYITGFSSGFMGSSAAIAWVIVILINVFTVIFLRILARGQA